jgi:two-component system sensor histidine kinase/response regulator
MAFPQPWAGFFDEAPGARRRLVLALYALVGPPFAGLLWAGRPAGASLLPLVLVVLLIAGPALLLALQPQPARWRFAVAVALPAVCCGLAARGLAASGSAFWMLLLAPLAWAAVLFDDAVVVAAWVASSGTAATLLGLQLGGRGLPAALLVAAIHGLVAWVVRASAQREREARAALREALEAARQASQVKSSFLANMSHEIRTPISGVLGMAELALGSDSGDEHREYLESIRSCGQHLLGVVDDILDLSKIEAQKLELSPVPFELTAIFGQALRAMAPRAREKGLELLCDLAPGLPAWVEGDPLRFRQVLLNLVGNAVKFTSHGRVRVRAETEGRALVVEVADTGVGIAPERQAHIFDAYAQADETIARRFGGTGLGLAISLELVRRMGGALTVDSQPGRGSTFRFTAQLPWLPAPVGAPPLRLAAAGEWALVVCADLDLRAHLVLEVGRLGYAAAAAADLDGAMAVLASGNLGSLRLRAAVVDEGVGVDLCSYLSTAQPDLRIVWLTGGAQPARSAAAGAPRVLVKPVLRPDLLRALASPEPPGAAAATPRTFPAPASRRLRVLVAEDTPSLAVITGRMLEKLGHSVALVEDGERAARRAAEERFDVVLMDVQMPEVDGFEATRRIRALPKERNPGVPIVALTASAMLGDDRRCLEAGMNAYLAKPLDVARLRAVIEELAAPPRPAGPSTDPGDAPPTEAAPAVPAGRIAKNR